MCYAPASEAGDVPKQKSYDLVRSSSSQRSEAAAEVSKKHLSTGSEFSNDFASQSQSQSTLVKTLSFVWFALCTSLVTKHNDMVAVFYSFVGSSLIAIASAFSKGRSFRSTFGAFYANANADGNSSANASNEMTIQERAENVSTRIRVGMIVCTSSLLLLTLPLHTSPASDMGMGKYFYFVVELARSFIKKSPEFHALANISGYLAFNLWYDCMSCRQLSFPPHLLCISEDVISLSVLSAILTKWDDWSLASFRYATPTISVFICYKLCRFILENMQHCNNTSQTATSATAFTMKEHLWTVHGEDYDLKQFVKSHPGGQEAILLGRGRDCTALFESYHPFTNRHRQILGKYRYRSGRPDKTQTHISEKDKDEFYNVLKERVETTLKEKGIDPNRHRAATIWRTMYYFIILTLLILSGSFHVLRCNPIGSFFFAVFGWLIGCLGHDAGHFAASRIPFLNDAGVWGISFLCNPIMWQHQHTFAHHSHTNDFDRDPDLHHFEILLRVHRRLKHDAIYKNQKHIWYVILAYALVVFGECIKIPIGMMKTGFLYDMVEFTDRKRPMRALGMYLHYIGYLALIVVAPFVAANARTSDNSDNDSSSSYSLALPLLCGVIHITTAGWLFAVFSQINHLNECSIETQAQVIWETTCTPKQQQLLKNSWAAQQVVTSNNFATRSLFWHVFSNGLNMQIEHHLFPGLNHCHLHLIQPTVQKTCEEYGVHYKSFESWSEVMGATLQWLEKLS